MLLEMMILVTSNFVTSYDRFKDITNVKVMPVIIANEKTHPNESWHNKDAIILGINQDIKGQETKVFQDTDTFTIWIGTNTLDRFSRYHFNTVHFLYDNKNLELKRNLTLPIWRERESFKTFPSGLRATYQEVLVPYQISFGDFKKISRSQSIEIKIGSAEIKFNPQIQSLLIESISFFER